MACDLSKWRRRIQWEYREECNSPCLAQRGFSARGTLARQWWLDPTTDPGQEWLWTIGGQLLDYDSNFVPPITAKYEDDRQQTLPKARALFQGFNEVQTTDEGQEYTVWLRLQLSVLVIAEPFQKDAWADIFLMAPNVRTVHLFSEWESDTLFPDELPESPYQLTPLACCHQCFTPT